MEILRIRQSKNTLVTHVIFDEPWDASTYSAKVLLNRDLHWRDCDFDRENDWRYLFIAKRTFLRHKRKNGQWFCHYCGKIITQMATRNQKWQKKSIVTVDHKDPACGVADKTDSTNFVPCCKKCNQRKGSLPYEEFIKKFKK